MHATTSATPVPAPPGTSITPSRAHQRATVTTHHSSGPVARTARAATGAAIGAAAAARVPTTVITGITGPAARFAAIPPTGTRPEKATTSGSVTTCATTVTASRLARVSGTRAVTRRSRNTGAPRTRPAVATTDRAKPMSRASAGRISMSTTIAANSATSG